MSLSLFAQFAASLILGFIFSDYFSGHSEGERIERGARFKLGAYRFSFHNWIWSTLILIACIHFGVTDGITLGIVAGAILQGLTYRDRFVILYKAEDFEKIYSKFY
ncbi:MAG: hypothetical protein WDN09_02880 [bacterium]